MSGDNAIIIAFATKWLPKSLRKTAMYIGIAGAVVLRILLASIALYLLQYPVAKYLGGVLLLYVAWSFFKTLKIDAHHKKIKEKKSLWWAIWVIIMADISLSLDNVLAVASVAENVRILAWWLLVSVVMMMFASQWIAKLMEKHQRIQRAWLIVIIHAALAILLESELWIIRWWIPIGIRWLLVMCAIITYLYISYLSHITFNVRKHQIHNHVRLWIIFVAFFVFFLSDFLPIIHNAIHHHIIERITLLFIAYMMLMELALQQWSIDKYYMKHQSKY